VETIILHPHSESDQHLNLTTSRRSPLARAYQVWSTSMTAFVSHLADDGHADTRDHNICFARDAQVIKSNRILFPVRSRSSTRQQEQWQTVSASTGFDLRRYMLSTPGFTSSVGAIGSNKLVFHYLDIVNLRCRLLTANSSVRLGSVCV